MTRVTQNKRLIQSFIQSGNVMDMMSLTSISFLYNKGLHIKIELHFKLDYIKQFLWHSTSTE